MEETTNMFSTTSFTNITSYPSLTHSTTSGKCASTVNRAIIPTLGATVGLLVVLLILVTMGWVYTCSRKTKLGLKSQNVRYVYVFLGIVDQLNVNVILQNHAAVKQS
jgi:hypothetical protein